MTIDNAQRAEFCAALEQTVRARDTNGTDSMKQRVTRELFDYWDTLRGVRPAPDRTDLDPGAIRSCLANTFVLRFDPPSGHPFRIAGTTICTLFGRELTRAPFQMLWSTGDGPVLTDMVRRVVHDADGAVADLTGSNADNEAVGLEMILLPMTGEGSGRILGAVTALAAPYWLSVRPLQTLHLGAWHHLSAASHSALPRHFRANSRTAHADGRR